MSTHLVPVQHRLISKPADVATVLHAAQARGHLLGMSTPERYSNRTVAVTVTLLQPPTTAIRRAARTARRRQVWRIVKPVAITLAVVAVAAGLGWAGWLAYRWAAAHWTALLITGLAILFAAAAVKAAAEDHTSRGGRR
jgi:hypothetical protein